MNSYPVVESPRTEKRVQRYRALKRVDGGQIAKRAKLAKGDLSSGSESHSHELHSPPGRPPRGSSRRSRQPTIVALAAEAVLELSRGGPIDNRAVAVARLRQAVHRDSRRRPRHAAVALATADALSLAPATLDVQQREALRRSAVTLLDPFISVGDERAVLTTLARAGLDRFSPLDEGPLAPLLD